PGFGLGTVARSPGELLFADGLRRGGRLWGGNGGFGRQVSDCTALCQWIRFARRTIARDGGGRLGAAAAPARFARRPRAYLGQQLGQDRRSEEHTSELQSRENLVCRLLLEKKKQHARE